MNCDMCDSSKNLVRAQIEGADMVVCQECAVYGKILGPAVVDREQPKAHTIVDETLELVVPDYADKVKRAREQSGLKQVDAAKQLHLKESLLQKLETGHAKPSLDLARKLEKFFRIKLVEAYAEEDTTSFMKTDSSGLTLGDALAK